MRKISSPFCSAVIFQLMAQGLRLARPRRWKTSRVASATGEFQWAEQASTDGSEAARVTAATPSLGNEWSSSFMSSNWRLASLPEALIWRTARSIAFIMPMPTAALGPEIGRTAPIFTCRGAAMATRPSIGIAKPAAAAPASVPRRPINLLILASIEVPTAGLVPPPKSSRPGPTPPPGTRLTQTSETARSDARCRDDPAASDRCTRAEKDRVPAESAPRHR